MAYTTPTNTTITYAELIAETDIQQWVDDLIWIGSLKRNTVAISGLANAAELMPAWGARAYNNGNVLHNSTGGWVAMTFNTETYDTDGIWEGVTNPTRFTASRAGIYSVFGCLSWANNATGMRGIRYKVNGTASNGEETYSIAGTGVTLHIAGNVKLTAGQYVEFDGFQNSGGNLNMNANGTFGIMGGISWIGVS